MYLVVLIWVEGLGIRGKPFARTSSLQDTHCQVSCEVRGSAEVGLQSVGLKDQGGRRFCAIHDTVWFDFACLCRRSYHKP